MTNREWLESLSDEKLAVLMAESGCLDVTSSLCNGYCAYTKDCCQCNCTEGIIAWLQSEHEEPKKELTVEQFKKIFRDKFKGRRAIGILEIEELIGELFR